jgi:vacuolar-type H+-ATPase subunit E/Vma4
MCNGFGMIVTKDMKAYFSEPDDSGDCSHSEILKRLRINDNTDQFLRNFVRVQCPSWKIKSFEFDEESSLPGWAEENRQEIINLVGKTLKKAYPARAKYKKVRDAANAEYHKVRGTARAEYHKVSDPAEAEYHKVSDAAWAEYEKVRDAAEAEYHKVCGTARAKYKKVRDAAEAEYHKVSDPAEAEYHKVSDAAWAEYEKVRDAAWAEFIRKLSIIPGYVRK